MVHNARADKMIDNSMMKILSPVSKKYVGLWVTRDFKTNDWGLWNAFPKEQGAVMWAPLFHGAL